MKNKEISKVLAGTLTVSMILNPCVGTVKSASALTISDSQDSSEDNSSDNDSSSDGSDEESTSDLGMKSILEQAGNGDVTTEEMRNDFESVTSASVSLMSIDEDSASTITDSTTSVTSNYGIDLSKCVFLSDINYIEDQSSVGYGKIMTNTNINGGLIQLLVDGTAQTFPKGMGAHANSTLVYDISDYSNKFSKLSTYLGVDYSQAGKGNGVKFTISASEDGKTWTNIYTSKVLLASDNAEYVNVSIEGYSYLKLYADKNGSDGNDHAVYGDLRLLAPDYNISSENYTGFKTLAEYDASISSRTLEDNYENHKQEILERELVNRVGYNNIINAAKYVDGVAEALDWLKSDEENLQLFIEAGGYYAGSGYNAIVALGKLYKEYKSDMNNLVYKKMLLATAVAYSKDIKTFLVKFNSAASSATPNSDPVLKYEYFKQLYDEGKFIKKSEFEEYQMELVRSVVDARMNDDEIFWLRDYIDKKHPNTDDSYRYSGYGYASYQNVSYGQDRFYDESNKTTWDSKYDFLKYNISYGDANRYRLWMLMEAGGICWGLTGIGLNVNEVQGVAAIGTYQPGHEAYLLYSKNSEDKGIWSIWNNVGGWAQSFTSWYKNKDTEYRPIFEWGVKDYNSTYGSNNSTYILLAQDALNDYDNYLKSMFYNLIANSYETGSEKHEEALNKSLECYSKNLDSLYGLYKSYKADSNTTDEEWLDLAERIANEYRYFPAPMVDLLNLIKECISDETMKIGVDIIKTESLTMASKATSNESLQDDACRAIANNLLGKESTALATFSFDGDNANTIVINDKYDNSDIQVRVSLDGGTTWETFENDNQFTISHKIVLTKEQLAKISSDKDILVGLMGVSTNYTIDILDGESIADNVYLNDDENLLIGGNTSNLEYSIDNGVTWNDYVSGLNSDTRIEGDTKALFRYKANGVYLQGPIREYTFTNNSENTEAEYIQLRNIKLYEYSSQQNTGDKAAANIIDGNYNTRWHTTWDWSDEEKYISFEFDKVRYISKISYLSYDSSGRLKSGNVYTSLDGENWEKVYTYSNLPNTTGWKDIDLGGSYAARYIKIDSTESHWLYSGQENLYVSGRMLNFYEDTTKEYKADVKIEYENVEGLVIAKLVLPSGCKVVGDSEHSFSSNGTFEFKYIDANGIEQSINAQVDSIDDSDKNKVPVSLEITKDDDKLTANLLNEDGSEFTTDAAVKYEWYRDDELVEEENGDIYNLSDEDKGKNINVKVSQYNLTSEKVYIDKPLDNETADSTGNGSTDDTENGSTDDSSKDETTDDTENGSTDDSLKDETTDDTNNDSDNDTSAVGVKIEGVKKVGYTLSGKLLIENSSEFTTDAAVTYEWYRVSSKDSEDGTLVGNDKTYKLVQGDIGKYIRLVVSYYDNIFENITSIITKKSSRNHSSSSSSSDADDTENNNSSNSNSFDINTDDIKNNNSSNNISIEINHGWKYIDDNIWIYNKNGKPVTGWNQIDNKWYLMDSNGIMQTGWKLVDNDWYYLNTRGDMETGWKSVNSKWYYLNERGDMATGWKFINNKWYYLNENGDMATGWKLINNKWYYLNENGDMAYDTVINGYRLGSDGAWIK